MGLATVLGVIAELSCASSTPAPPPVLDATPPSEAEQELERRLQQATQQHRRSLGLPPLGFDRGMARLARSHSQAIAAGRRPLSHRGFDARAAWLREHRGSVRSAENVGYTRGFRDCASQLLDDWLASPEHRAHLEGAFALSGVGAAIHADTCYATQIFVQLRPGTGVNR